MVTQQDVARYVARQMDGFQFGRYVGGSFEPRDPDPPMEDRYFERVYNERGWKIGVTMRQSLSPRGTQYSVMFKGIGYPPLAGLFDDLESVENELARQGFVEVD